MNWIPDDYRNPNAAGSPVDGGRPAGMGASAPGGPAGQDLEDSGQGSAHGLPPAPSPSGGLPDLSPVAVAAGLVGLLTGPVLIGDPTARYVILVADLVAIVFGILGIWASFKRYARLDYAVAALIMGGFSLYLWISYVRDPPAGGT